MSRALVGLAGALLVLPLLAGCGRQSYCDAVHGHQAELGRITASGSKDALLQALPIFRDLQGRSPSDVADDWQLLVTRISGLQTALSQAHVDPATYDPKHPPSGLTHAQRTAILRAAAALGATDTQQALTVLQQEALDVCHTPLEL